jgi:hypothetical protein
MVEDKEKFLWKEGGVLNDKNAVPLGDVRQHGLPKVNKAVAADPVVRKEEREDFLASSGSRPYPNPKKVPAKPDETIIIEESHSGVIDDVEDSEVKHLTDKGKKIRGLDRFGKK